MVADGDLDWTAKAVANTTTCSYQRARWMLAWLVQEAKIGLEDAEALVRAIVQAESAMGWTVNVWDQVQAQLKASMEKPILPAAWDDVPDEFKAELQRRLGIDSAKRNSRADRTP